MKKAFKWLLPIMVIALLVGALCVIASAETAEPTVYYTVTAGDGTVVEYTTNEITAFYAEKDDTAKYPNGLGEYTVDMKADCTWKTGTETISMNGKATYNLNGYTLTLSATKTGTRFSATDGCDYTFNGGTNADGAKGKITNPSNTAKFYMDGAGTASRDDKLTFNGVDITATTLFDVRNGYLYLNGCDIHAGTGVVFNMGGTANNDKIMNVILDGCTLDADDVKLAKSEIDVHDKDVAVFQQGRHKADGSSAEETNAHLTIKNCVINSARQYLVKNRNAYAKANPDHFNEHTVTIENSTVNAPGTVLLGWNNPDSKTQLTLGAGCDINVGKLLVDETNENNSLVVAEGYEIAYAGNGACLKTVAVADNSVVKLTATLDGETLAERPILKGSAPSLADISAVGYHYASKTVKKGTVAWTDAEGNAVTSMTEDAALTATVTLSSVAWSAFSHTTLVDRYIVYVSETGTALRNNLKSNYAYVLLGENCTYDSGTSKTTEKITWNCTIDLGGHTLAFKGGNTDGCYSPEGATLTIKNGTVTVSTVKISYNHEGGHIVLEGLKITSPVAIVDNRGGNTTVKDCDIDIQGEAYNFFGIGNTDTKETVHTFENVNVYSSTGNEIRRLITLSTGSKTDKTLNPTININGLTADIGIYKNGVGIIHINTALPMTLNVTDAKINTFETGPAISCIEGVTSSTTLNLDGLRTADTASLTNSIFAGATVTGSVIVNNGASDIYRYSLAAEGNYETETWTVKGSTFTTKTLAGKAPSPQFLVVENGVPTVYVIDADWAATSLTAAVAAGTASYEPTVVKASYAVFNSSDEFLYAYTETSVPVTFLNTVFEDGIVRAYADLSINAGTGINPRYKNVTVDLGGKELDLCGTGDVRISPSGKTVTFKNGTIYNDYNIAYSANDNSVIIFDNVTLETSAVAFDFRGGTVKFLNGTTAKISNTFITAGNRGGKNVFVIDSSSVDCATFLNVNPANKETKIGTVDLTVTNSTVKADTLLTVGNRNSVVAKYTVNVSFSGSKVNAGTYFNLLHESIQSASFSDCWLNKIPDTSLSTDNAVAPNVAYAEGERFVNTSDATYTYRLMKVTLPVSANLTLFSDFNLNLFLDKKVTAVTAKGGALTLEDAGDCWKAVVKSIAAAEAAEDTLFTVYYVEDGVTYNVDFTYSVVKYAKALLAGENYSDESKALVASVVNYVSKAYTYAGNSNDTLANLVADESFKVILATASDLTKESITATGNYTALGVAIDSAQLALSDDYKYVLNLNPAYSGTLTVNGVEYTVDEGKVNGKTSVTVTLRGYEFNAGLTVTAATADGTVEGTYTLADYVKAMADGKDADFDSLLVALYNFTVEAKEYKAYVDANGLQ